jgi:ATP-dependent Lon protease
MPNDPPHKAPDSLRRESGDLETLPVLPLRNAVLYPAQVVPINVGRPRSVRLIEELFGRERPYVAIAAQRKPEVEEPSFKDLYEVGVIAKVVKVIRMSAGSYSVVLQGASRMRILEPLGLEPYMRARIQRLHDKLDRDVELDALGTTLRETTREVLELKTDIPRETAGILDNVREPGALADLIASNFPTEIASIDDKQQVLQTFDVKSRVKFVLQIVTRQLELLRVKKEISSMVQEEMGKSQREFILRQQIKAIREELGEGGEEDEVEELRDKIAKAALPPEVDKIAKKQLARLQTIPHQRTTTASRRSRSASSSTSPCASSPRRRRGPSCASSGPPASARRRSGAASRARPGASCTASRSAACATRPRFAGIGAPTWARSPDASSRVCAR